jgi:hypothetical protein
MIAALYIDERRSPYLGMGLDCWGESRDATRYDGPGPVIAHPPCGHWGRYAHRCHDDGHTGPIAVEQVRRLCGVLEQPKDSRLFLECGIPKPGEFPDAWGGYSILVYQRDWGHRADKPTWLYIVGASSLPPMPPALPSREHKTAKRRTLKNGAIRHGDATRGVLECLSKNQRHLTPEPFARWLIALAETSR